MTKLAATLVTCLLAASAMAQACIDSNYGTSLGSANDTVHPAQSIGHAFPFNGTTYTDVHISDHGVMWLSNGGTPTPAASGATTYNVLLSDFTMFGPCIAPMWADANCGYIVGNQGEVLINNSDPTKCVITWSNILTYQDIPPAYTFQATLFDTGEIKFVYDAMVNNYGSTFAPNAIVGVTPGSGALLPAASDLSTGPLSTDPSMFEEFTVPSTFDLNGGGISLIPLNPGWLVVPYGPASGCAEVITYGTSCGQSSSSLYEEFADATVASAALTGQSMTFTNIATGYLAVWNGSPAYVPPTAAATPLALTDDGEVVLTPSAPLNTPFGSFADLVISGNGIIGFGNTPLQFPNATSFLPNASDFLLNGGVFSWHDYNVSEGGQVLMEEIAGTLYITFDAVESYSNPTAVNPSTLQFQLELASGTITIAWDSIDSDNTSLDGSAHLIGITGPGASLDPGATTLSSGGPFITGLDTAGLELNANAPKLGSNWNLTTTGIDAISPAAITFFGNGQGAGLPFSAIGLDAPGCSIWLNTVLATATGVNVAGSSTITLPLPNNPALTGSILTGQSICLTLQNPANLLSSNGLQGTLGL
jgi:hypothetical protein